MKQADFSSGDGSRELLSSAIFREFTTDTDNEEDNVEQVVFSNDQERLDARRSCFSVTSCSTCRENKCQNEKKDTDSAPKQRVPAFAPEEDLI
ncbi:unnamed protein product [Amoebophrya sp. A120]|nr:unnamed protein product [Amoebophrya sp. A120]|eukprot:GSA120T00012650001.1